MGYVLELLISTGVRCYVWGLKHRILNIEEKLRLEDIQLVSLE